MSVAGGVLVAVVVVLVVIAVGVVVFAVFLRKARASAPPAAMPGATGVQWRPIGPDPRLLSRAAMGIPAGGQALAQPVGAAVDTSYRGRYAVAFTYGWVNVTLSVRPTVRFAAVVSLDLPRPLPMLQLVPREGGQGGLDQRFDITGQDSEFARLVLDSAVGGLLMADQRGRYYPVRFDGATVSSWTGAGADPSLPWQRIDQMLDFLTSIVERVPTVVWERR
jgi:hypothetical protein